ncbi:MAG: tRNA guanosine(34) transglycosylase Tgt [bacterium]
MPAGDVPHREGTRGFSFTVEHRPSAGAGRVGRIRTPHGDIATPAFIPVGTKATVKAVLPESMRQLGAQAVLANAYHLHLQPGSDIVDEAGGLGAFMNWSGPTFTDSGGFQVLSLGAGFTKVLAMDVEAHGDDDVIAEGKDRLAVVDDDGVTFRSHLDGSTHRFTPEVSMQVQHRLGADIIFAFDECTTLFNTREYQERSLERTHAWARRCIEEHERLTEQRSHRPYQALFAVVQGAQHEDLRRRSARELAALGMDGFGIGGAISKADLTTIVEWVTSELPDDRPRHLLGIGEPGDLFAGVAAGADTFDCVSPSREARNAAVYSDRGRFNLTRSENRRAFDPIDPSCDCYTCAHYTRAYLHHAFKGREMIASTLATIHNVRFAVRLVDRMREALVRDDFDAFREDFLGRYYGSTSDVA